MPTTIETVLDFIQTTTDHETINTVRDAAINQGEKVTRLESVPAQIAEITARYVADGGDKQTIVSAVTDA